MEGGRGSGNGHERPLVTIAIPTYNRAATYLPVALGSALAQRYAPLEVLVSDNCSTDGTEAFVRGRSDERLRYVRHARALTPNENFNFCLAQARGAYFQLLHDDDAIDPDFVSACLERVGYRTDVGVIRTGVRVIDARGHPLGAVRNEVVGMSTSDFFLAWFEGRTALYLANTLYQTGYLRNLGGFQSRHNLFQDGLATVRLAARHGRADVPDVLASFRVHAGELTRAARVREWCEDSLEVLDAMCREVGEREPEIRERGRRFFATVNYRRAAQLRPLRERLSQLAFVFRFFGGRYLPPGRLLLQSTAFYRGLRNLKRRVLGRPQWAA